MTKDPTGILRILAFFGRHDLCDAVWWRCDGEYAPVTFLVNCNDLFYWGEADCEEVTPENLPILEQAVADARAIDDVLGALRGCALFCCRVRKMRPQQPAYPTDVDKAAWRALFDACGPVRDPKDEG